MLMNHVIMEYVYFCYDVDPLLLFFQIARYFWHGGGVLMVVIRVLDGNKQTYMH